MNGSTRAGIAALLLVVIWIVVYWRTTPPAVDASVGVQGLGGVPTPALERRDDPPMRTLAASGEEAGRAGVGAGNAQLEVPPPSTASNPVPLGAPAPAEPASTPPDAQAIADAILARAKGAGTIPAVQPAQPQPKPGETIPPTFDMYEVQKGDNAQVISQKRYGTTKHWKAILKANPLLDFTRLKPGRVIKVPHDPENTQGIVVEAPTTPGSGDYVEYTVASGDTLMGIAKALYGKSSMWEEIRKANPSLDEDGTNLKPGMKLKVPPPTKGAGR